MTKNDAASNQGWDVALYDQSFGFIAEFGAGLVELLAPSPGERIVDLRIEIPQGSASWGGIPNQPYDAD